MTEFVRLFGIFCFSCVVCFGQVPSVVQHHQKVCINENFHANCERGKVILIVEALFGRMRNDSGCLVLRADERPCFADARLFAERQCSGRRSCSINPNNDNLKLINGSCNKYVEKFLDVVYRCQDVYSADDETCVSNRSLIVSQSSGYLASVVVDESGKGSSFCPWRFEPRPGESVNLTLMDFGVWEDRGERARRGICRIYATVRSLPSTTNSPVTTLPILVCGGKEREQSVITTTSHLEIGMTNKSSDPQNNAAVYFLFKFQVFTCPDIKTPPGAEVENLGSAYRVFCSGERRIHQDLSCAAGHWMPPINLTCAKATAGPPPSSSSSSGSESLCPEYVRSNGESSVESIESSPLRLLLVVCVNGDSFEVRCRDGNWMAAQNKNCSSSEQTVPQSFSWEKYLVPGGLMLLAVVVVIIVVVMCFSRRNKSSKMNEMNQRSLDNNCYMGGGGGGGGGGAGSALRPISGDYDVLDEYGMQANRGSLVGAPAAAAPGGGGGCSSSGYSLCGGAPRVHQTLPRNDPWSGGLGCPLQRRSDSLPLHRRLPEPHEYTTTLPRDSTYLVPKEEDIGDPHHYDTVKANV